VNRLLTRRVSLFELVVEHGKRGLAHIPFMWIHVLLILALFGTSPGRKIFGRVAWLALGGGISLVLADLNVPGFEPFFVDALGLLLVFLVASSALQETHRSQINVLLVTFGALHGLAYATQIRVMDVAPEQQIAAVFAFNAGVEVGHLVVALGLVAVNHLMASWKDARRLTSYVTGSLAVAALLSAFWNEARSGDTDVFDLAGSVNATDFALPGGGRAQSVSQSPRGAQILTTPIMSFLTVEPFEVRQEIMVRARTAVQLLGVDDRGKAAIPIESQDAIKLGLLELFEQNHTLWIAGDVSTPEMTRADFVSLGAAGVAVRDEPQVESLDDGIIGLSLVYSVPDMPDHATLEWRMFTEAAPRIEASAVDPFGASTAILSEESPVFEWQSRLQGYRVPIIDQVTVERPALPLPSMILFLLAGGLGLRFRNRESGRPLRLAVVAVVAGFLVYPFLRTSLGLPVVNSLAPSKERTAVILDDLLTNVYRSFDVRNEEDVYDRLQITVTGDQLANIYLQNRRSLEFEDRGGARARVDAIDIRDINNVTSIDGGGFIVDSRWLAAGSVSHFGHTHYRRNLYHALVTIVPVDGAWKISNVEMIEEERLL
jgi:hypothetical protein